MSSIQKQIAALTILVGIWFRYHFIFYWHDPADYIFSDMKSYVDMAHSFFDPHVIPNIADTVFPPGAGFFYGFLAKIDSSWILAHWMLFLMSCFSFVLLATIALVTRGATTSLVTLILSCLYYPIIEYFGFYLSEGPFTFFITLGTFLLILGFKSIRPKNQLAFGLASGVVFGLAFALKSMILISFLTFIVITFVSRYSSMGFRNSIRLPLCLTLGFLSVMLPLSGRCTRLSEGQFCLSANEAARGFLIGHIPGIAGAVFTDKFRGLTFEFASATSIQKGLQGYLEVPIGVYETQKLNQFTWERIKDHRLSALKLSLENIRDLFAEILPWPGLATPYRPWSVPFTHWIFPVICVAALAWMLLTLKYFFTMAQESTIDWMLISLCFCPVISAFLSVGEPRYRIPFDGFYLLLAVNLFIRIFSPVSTFGSKLLKYLVKFPIFAPIGFILYAVNLVYLQQNGTLERAKPWLASFFNNQKFEEFPATRTFKNIDFAWDGRPPIYLTWNQPFTSKHFTARIQSCIHLVGKHSISGIVSSDDGVRIFVDQKILASSWYKPENSDTPFNTKIPSGDHPIRIDYFQNDGVAKLKIDLLVDGQWIHPNSDNYLYLPTYTRSGLSPCIPQI